MIEEQIKREALAAKSRSEFVAKVKQFLVPLDKLDFLGIKEFEDFRKSLHGIATGQGLLRPLPTTHLRGAADKYKLTAFARLDAYYDKARRGATERHQTRDGVQTGFVQEPDLHPPRPVKSKDPRATGDNVVSFEVMIKSKWAEKELDSRETMTLTELSKPGIRFLRS